MPDDFATPLELRIDSLIARCRGAGRPATRREVEDLYTEGCAEALGAEARCAQIDKKLGAADRTPDLAAERAALQGRLTTLRAQLRHLRAAVDWAEEEHDLDDLLRLD